MEQQLKQERPETKQQGAEPKARTSVIGAVNTALGFFVLALLIVESFLAAAMIGAHLDSSLQQTCIYAGIGMFVLVVLLVFTLVWARPSNILFDKETIANTKVKF
jgi:hypothetical protein